MGPGMGIMAKNCAGCLADDPERRPTFHYLYDVFSDQEDKLRCEDKSTPSTIFSSERDAPNGSAKVVASKGTLGSLVDV